jgi:hypothetical protein
MTPLSRRARRAFRWIALSATFPALWACNARSVEAPTVTPSQTTTTTYQETLNRKIDILFMVDNSNSMEKSQENLRRNFPRFMEVLQRLRDGLPDVHIAVVSSDMGDGIGVNDPCNATGGDNGVFRSGVGAGAIGVTSTGLHPGEKFIASTGGIAAQNNFDGDITQVFQAIAPIGAGGCGYENQLRSVARALGADGRSSPAENAGFLRPEAYLGIVFITNEDDCSAQDPARFYNQSPDFLIASRLGPPGEFRCAEFGYLCGGVAPSRHAPNGVATDTMSYAGCVSAEGGELVPVKLFADAIKNLKPGRPEDVLVASIQGPVLPAFNVEWKSPHATGDPPWPDITHSCTASDDSFADPGIRMQQFVREFGGNGLTYSICDDDFGPALTTIATKFTQFLQPKCVTGQIAVRPGSTTEDCTVIDSVPDDNNSGRRIEAKVPACADNGGAAPCWRLVRGTGDPPAGNGCAPDRHLVETVREGTPSDNLRISVSCSICVPGVADAARGCPG